MDLFSSFRERRFMPIELNAAYLHCRSIQMRDTIRSLLPSNRIIQNRLPQLKNVLFPISSSLRLRLGLNRKRRRFKRLFNLLQSATIHSKEIIDSYI